MDRPFHLVAPDPATSMSWEVGHAPQLSRQVRRHVSVDRTVTTQPRAVSTGENTPNQVEWTPHGRCYEWRLRSVASSVSRMRRGLRDLLDQAGLSYDEIEDLVLAASEAAANAVDHARSREPFFDVCTEVTNRAVTIVIQDHGLWRPPTPDSDRGRGLRMMHALADTTVAARANGTTVTIRHRRSGHGERSAETEWAT
jgi:anti-sigma regulatory factor (Ser/Thr protein kinase)